MKKAIYLTAIACLFSFSVQAEEAPKTSPSAVLAEVLTVKADPEWSGILDHFVNQDVPAHIQMPAKQRALLSLAVLTAIQMPEEIPGHVRYALSQGATPEQIRETILQTAPYVGFPRAKASLKKMYKTFQKEGIKTPLPPQGTVTEETRYDKGLEKQVAIAGERIIRRIETSPADEAHINTFLASNCFGDYYTRNILSLQERELITFTTIASLGGADPQVKGHVAANVQVGNTRQQLLDAITIALPYIGYPRTLNALAAINSVVPAK